MLIPAGDEPKFRGLWREKAMLLRTAAVSVVERKEKK